MGLMMLRFTVLKVVSMCLWWVWQIPSTGAGLMARVCVVVLTLKEMVSDIRHRRVPVTLVTMGVVVVS